jgi:hypothetical protein
MTPPTDDKNIHTLQLFWVHKNQFLTRNVLNKTPGCNLKVCLVLSSPGCQRPYLQLKVSIYSTVNSDLIYIRYCVFLIFAFLILPCSFSALSLATWVFYLHR